MNKLSDIFIAISRAFEGLIQYFLQLLLLCLLLHPDPISMPIFVEHLLIFFNIPTTYINRPIIYSHLLLICYIYLFNLFQKMARNCEKAQGMLNRWWMMKRCLINKEDDERPKGLRHIRQINNLQQCEKWRKQVQVKIIEKLEVIQNRAKPQNQTRAINDDINRLLRQLYHWEIRIKQLGGNDYRTIKNAKMYDSQGRQIPGFGGYRYFGAAKDLPGVKDVYKRQVPIAPERTSAQIRKVIDQQYFGDSQLKNQELIKQQTLEEETKREGELVEWIEANKKKIQQFFKGRQPEMEELMDNIDNIQDFEVELQEQMIEQKQQQLN